LGAGTVGVLAMATVTHELVAEGTGYKSGEFSHPDDIFSVLNCFICEERLIDRFVELLDRRKEL
jgi:hypothetical protein